MRVMSREVRFVREFALPITLATISFAWVGVGGVSTVYGLIGLAGWAWNLIGMFIMLSGFIIALYKVAHREEAAASAPPNPAKATEAPSEDRSSKTDDASALRNKMRNALINPDQLYVGEISVSANPLQEEHAVDIAFRFFNATDKHLAVSSVRGSVELGLVVNGSIPDKLKFELPTPNLRDSVDDVPPLTETMIVLRQHLPPKLASKVKAAAKTEGGLRLYFDDLGIIITGRDDRTWAAVLPIAGGAYLRTETGVRSGRSIRGKLNVTLG